jgi:hypothetical protein
LAGEARYGSQRRGAAARATLINFDTNEDPPLRGGSSFILVTNETSIFPVKNRGKTQKSHGKGSEN